LANKKSSLPISRVLYLFGKRRLPFILSYRRR